jgi:hypothetical protein
MLAATADQVASMFLCHAQYCLDSFQWEGASITIVEMQKDSASGNCSPNEGCSWSTKPADRRLQLSGKDIV